MPLYAGVYETNITPPAGVWMGGYAGRPTGCVGVHDELYARALVLENGRQRVGLVTCDLISLDFDLVAQVREGAAAQAGIAPEALMLHCSHTHGGPNTKHFLEMGERDAAYCDVLVRKLVGAVRQAAANLLPATLTVGEAPVQIGVNRRETATDGRVVLGADYGGPVAPLVQTLCVNGTDGRTFALLFCHACHPTTVGRENLHITAEWPGAAVAHLKERFRRESAETGLAENALPFCLQGCCGDINPIRRGTWEAVATNGRLVADAAHTARWNAHGQLDETLDAQEVTVELPLLPPSDVERLLFTFQKLTLGGVHLLGFPAELFVQYQQDFRAQSLAPVFSLSYTNGCWNYLPTAAEYARGGYEVSEAFYYYDNPMFAPESEALLRAAVYRLLTLDAPDLTPYPLHKPD